MTQDLSSCVRGGMHTDEQEWDGGCTRCQGASRPMLVMLQGSQGAVDASVLQQLQRKRIRTSAHTHTHTYKHAQKWRTCGL